MKFLIFSEAKQIRRVLNMYVYQKHKSQFLCKNVFFFVFFFFLNSISHNIYEHVKY